MSADHFPELDLTPLMAPKVIGIVGASQRASRGTRVLNNLKSFGFEGSIYPINPRYEEIQGLPCYPSPSEVPEVMDSIVVAIPGAGVPDLLEQAKAAGTKAAVVLSSGFREAGPEGLARHHRLEQLARSGMPICGPNCYGVLNMATKAATFSGPIPNPPRVGPLALVSQSGGFTTSIANPLVEDRGLGFKYMVSCGNQVGAKVEDYLSFLVDDPDVQVIGAFVEGLSSAGAIIDVGRRAAERGKTIVMLKSGRSARAREAVASHTGSVAGASEVVDATLRQAGIISVQTLDELAETMALVAVGNPARIGRRVMVVTGSGGESSHAADAAERAGLDMPQLDPSTAERLASEVLPDFGNPRNPLDGTGAMFEDPTVFPRMMDIAVQDAGFDVVAVNLGQRPPEGPWAPMREFAKHLAAMPEDARRKIVGYSSMSGGPIDGELVETLISADIPLLTGSGPAMKALAAVARANEEQPFVTAPAVARQTTRAAWGDGPLGVGEVWRIMDAYGLPVSVLEVVTSEEEALSVARAMGFPVAIKIASFAVSHKSDIGGVVLGVDSEEGVRRAYNQVAAAGREHAGSDEVIIQAMAPSGVELLVGIVRDPALGPAVVVGSGGLFVELLGDAQVAVPPVSPEHAERLLRGLRGSALLTGIRGSEPADVSAAADLISRVSEMALDLPESVRAVDFNPVMVHPDGSGASFVDVWVEYDGS